jgi:hypothetical protein
MLAVFKILVNFWNLPLWYYYRTMKWAETMISNIKKAVIEG